MSINTFEAVYRDVRLAIRKIRRTPAVSAIVLVSLALGVGANTALFGVARGMLRASVPYRDADRAVSLGLFLRDAPTRITAEQASLIAETARSLERVEAWSMARLNWRRADSTIQVFTQTVTPGLPAQMGMAPLVGRGFTADDGARGAPPVAIISERLWRREFGSAGGIIGTHVMLEETSHTIVGVTKPPILDRNVDLWVPRALRAAPDWTPAVVAWLRPGASLSQASADVALLGPALTPDSTALLSVRLASLSERAADNPVGRMLTLFWGASGLVLAIVCANLMTLLLARNLAGQREMAVRAALGAGRLSVVRLLVTEAVVLALIGGTAGLLVAKWGTEALLALRPLSLSTIYPAAVPLDITTIGYNLLVALVAGVIVGGVPALRAAHGDVARGIGRDDAQVQRSFRARWLFGGAVALQAALAVVLLAAAGLLIESYVRLTRVQPGFDADHLIEMTVQIDPVRYKVPAVRREFFENLADRVGRLGGVADVAVASDVPPHGTVLWGPIEIEGRTGDALPSAQASWVHATPSYFRVLGIRQLEGGLLPDRADATDQVVVSHSFARRYWPQGSAVGERFRIRGPKGWRPWLRVVGVVSDVAGRGPRDRNDEVYVPHAASTATSAAVVVRTGQDPESLFQPLRSQVWALDPGVPVTELVTVRQGLARSYDEQPFYAVLLGSFAAIALALAAAGVFGVAAYAASQRRREIGIRLALGAHAKDVERLMLRQGVVAPIIGALAGVAVSLGLARFVESLLFGVTATSPGVYIASVAAIVGISLFATWLPTRRASRADPLLALRAD